MVDTNLLKDEDAVLVMQITKNYVIRGAVRVITQLMITTTTTTTTKSEMDFYFKLKSQK